MHIEVFLEEPSAEAFLVELFPKLLPANFTWNSIVFQGKRDLLANIEKRLKGYRSWFPQDWRILVLIDEDRQNCRQLKSQLENAASSAGFLTKTASRGRGFSVLNRIVVEELESWFFGDVSALAAAFPGVPASLAARSQYRDPDAIAGGTWEALEKILKRAGYYSGGIAKIEVAREVARRMDPARNRSCSFKNFVSGVAAFQI